MNRLKQILSLPVIIVFTMLLSMYPYNFYLFYGLPRESQMVAFFALISLIYVSIKTQGATLMPRVVILCMIVQAISWFLFYYYHNDTSYLTRIVFLFLAYISLRLLLYRNKTCDFMKLYGSWFSIQAICGSIAFVLIFVGLLKPISTYTTDEFGWNVISNFGLTCSNAVYGNFVRVAGFFDEPGAFASWGVFAMIINKLTYNNRKFEIIMAVSLLFTFSAAYFVLMAMYIVLYYGSTLKKSMAQMILVVILIGGVGYLLRDNATFRYMTIERFEDGQIRSKRDIAAESAKKVFEENVFMGIGARNLQNTGETTSDNPYEILAKDGILGYAVTYLPLIILLFKYIRKRDVLFSILILMASYSQRPFHINEMHYFMIYLFLIIVVMKNENLLILNEDKIK